MLQRIQLILDAETKDKLQRAAISENRSMSFVARKILKENLKENKLKKKYSGSEFLLKLAENAISGPANSDYDKYAYDE